MLEQWIIATAVLFTLSYADLTESCSNCSLLKDPKEINRQIKRVDENATATFSCLELEKDEEYISSSLHKEDTKLHPKDEGNYTDQSFQRFQLFTLNSSVSFKISSTEANDQGLYCCTVQTNKRTKTSEIILIIADPQPTEPPLSCSYDQTVPLTVVGIIGAYNLFITVLSCFLTCKLKNKEPPENTYMNTRIREFKRC